MSKALDDKGFVAKKFETAIEHVVDIYVELSRMDTARDVQGLSEEITANIQEVISELQPKVRIYVSKCIKEIDVGREALESLTQWATEQMPVDNPEKWVMDNFIVIDGKMTCRHKNFSFEKNAKLSCLPDNTVFYDVSIAHCPQFNDLNNSQLHNLSIVGCANFSIVPAATKLETLRLSKCGALEIKEACKICSVFITDNTIASLPEALAVENFCLVDCEGNISLPDFGNAVLQSLTLENIPELRFSTSHVAAQQSMLFLKAGIVDENGQLLADLSAPKIRFLDIDIKDVSKATATELVLDNCSIEVIATLSVKSLTVLRCFKLVEVRQDCFAEQVSFRDCPNIELIPAAFQVHIDRYLRVL